MTTIWMNGGLCDEADARISPFDHGLLTGDGVFETLKVYDGRPFAVRRHLERLAISAGGLGLTPPDAGTLREAIEAVVAANDFAEARIRITVTGGPSPLGSERGTSGPLVIIAGGTLHPWPPSVDVVIVPWTRNERGALSGLKTISYGENVKALAYARERDAGEALFPNCGGNLCEGTGTNVFASFGGRLVTPPLSSGCLAGVTRALVVELTGAAEEDIDPAALASVDEAFLTSTTREVQAIRAVDGKALASCPGPITQSAAQAFADLAAKDLDP